MKKKFVLEVFYQGEMAAFLTIRFIDETLSEADKFFTEHKDRPESSNKIFEIFRRIKNMSERTGILPDYFKDEGPGNVHRFRNTGSLRLLCLPYGRFNLILGGGAVKPSGTIKYQESEDYYNKVKIMRAVDKVLLENEVNFTDLLLYENKIFEMEWPL